MNAEITTSTSQNRIDDDDTARFHLIDYCVFGCLFLLSAGIGVYFAVKDRKKNTSDNYLLAGRSLSGIPVALSLTASFMSAITVLGTPAEIYIFGTMYWWMAISYAIAALVTATVFVPVFYKMKIASIYEYLQERFNTSVRIAATISFIIQTILYMGMVMYMPALALNKVTGLSLIVSILTTALVCIFYTTIGGMKAVVWNDVFQCVVMSFGFIAILIRGVMIVGGLDRIVSISSERGRIDFWQFDPDPRVRHTIWSVCIGGTLTWLAVYGVNQSMVQRYLSCRSLAHAKLSLAINYVGLLVILSLACLTGLVMFAVYYDCDPLSIGKIDKSDQLSPYLVMDIFRTFPGIPGLFVASAYSGTLSTVSTGINALACSTYEDLIKPYIHVPNSRAVLLSKILVVIYGGLGLGVAFLVSLVNNILTLALKVFGLIGGPILGVFFLGVFTPTANSIGTLAGLIVGIVSGMWLGVGSLICPPTVEFTKKLPLSTDGCTDAANISSTTMSTFNAALTTSVVTIPYNESLHCDESSFPGYLYSLSYCHYSTFLVLITWLVGILVSLCTGGLKTRSKVAPHLLAYSSDSCLCCKCSSSGDKTYVKGTRTSEDNSNIPLEKTDE